MRQSIVLCQKSLRERKPTYFDKAADIRIPKTAYTDWDDNKPHTDKELAEHWFSWFQSNTDFNQLSLETLFTTFAATRQRQVYSQFLRSI